MQHSIRQCQADNCRFRFPVTETDVGGEQCPLCKTATTLIRTFSPALVPADVSAPPTRRVSALLDNLRSTYNVGACFRSADGAALEALYLCGMTATPRHPRVRKTALGSENNVTWHYDRNALECAKRLKENGATLLALEGGVDAVSLFELPVSAESIVFIVGNEVTGVDPALRELADASVAIPMRGNKASLNVSTAFGIAAYHFTTKKTP